MRPSGGFLWKSDSVKARQPSHRLVLEALEDRLVPAQIFVTTPDDVLDQADGLISLREAIQQANLNPDHDDIFFPNTALNYQIKLNTPTNFGPTAFVISSDIAFRPSPGTTCTLSISPNAPPMRFFWVQPTGNLQLNDLTIFGGRIQGGSGGMGSTGTTGDIDGAGGGGGAGLGGAIYNQGTLTIERVTFIDNQTKGGEGGTGSTTSTTSGFGGGGGSLSGPGQPGTSTSGGVGAVNAGSGAGPFGTGTNGSMGGGGGGAGSITSAKGGNGGFGGGGGAYGGHGGYGAGNGAPLNSATGGGGGGGAGMGGAIFNESGNITISNSTFIDNQAFGGLAGPGGAKGLGIGGAIANLNGNVTISSSTFSANSNNAAEQAGSLVNIAINGLTANVVSRNSIFETSISTPEFASFQASGSTATFSGNNNIVFNGSLSSPLGIISNSSALLGTTVIAPTGALVVPLTPGSPAIGAATPTGLFPFDQRQIKRQMAPSIGAYEYYAPPTSINISASSFAGQLENGQMIGTISAIGPFAGTAFSFSLVAGIGDTDNAEFHIRNNELFTTGQLAVGNYSICVRATGAAGDSYDQAISLVAKSDIVVNTPNDIVDPLDGKTSLREAIAEANLNPDHDRITFDNALRGIPVVLESVGSTAEGSSALVVSTAVSIQGLTSSTDFRIDPSSEMRFFRVETTGNLRLENIDLSGGLARGNKSGDINGKGGAILAHGPVSLIRSSILGARVYGAGGANPGNAMGGAIYTNANLDLLESTVADNKLFRGNDSTVAGQYTPSSSGNYYGAGIYAEATLKPISLNFQSVTIARNQGDNQVNFAGGAIAIAPGLTPASGTIFFNANALVVQSDGNPADIDILPGLGSVDFNASNSFAGTLGSGVPTNGFTIGDPLLDYSTTGSRQSPVFRPQAGSPLIHAISNRTGQTDQTNLIRFSISAAGAAEYYAPPQGIIESETQLGERLPEGLEAGILRVQTSRESGSDFTFELVSGTGDTNNNAFRLEYIAGQSRDSAQIYSKQSFLASDGDRSIRVRVTGPTGLSIEQIVSITISPTIVVDTPDDITDNLDGKTSLREALAQATNQPGIDRISFSPNLAGQTVYVGPDPTSMASTSAFVVNSSVLISGRDAPGLMIQPSAGSNIRFFNVSPFENLGLDALTLQGGNAVDGEGGAIFSDGGNIYLDSVTVRNNKASQVMAAGGAIRINNGTLEIVNSTFFNNSVENATGSGNFIGEGGHILATTNLATSEHSYGNSSPKFSIINSTFSNGSATGTSDGVAFITSSTTPTTVEVTGSVFANSTGNDISFIQIDNSLFSVNFNNNFVTTSGGLLAGLNFFTGDPMLGTLADNGGPTPTMEPLSGSPLIALNGIPPSNQPDQRGIIRGSKPTLGAFQVVQATNLSFTPTSGSLGIGSKAVSKIDFSHPVTYYGQPAIDLNVSGAQALAPTQPNGSIQSSFITLQYTVREGDSTNNLTASYANGGTFDVRDGVNHAVLIPQYNLVTGLNVDGIRPVSTLALTPNPGTTSNALTFSGTISFSEPVSGALLANDFKLTNATVSGISGPDAAGNYSFTLTPSADGKVSVAVIAPGITDGAGNSSVPSNNITFFSDKSPPAAQISLNTTAGGLTNINNLNGKVAFGEPVTGNLSVNDFTVVNATVSNISGPDANGIYTFNLNPTANGLVAVSLNAPSITDLAGNSATPASPFDFTFDNSSATPTVFLNPVPNNASNALSFFGSVAFGETVTGTLLSSDFKLTNANVSDISGPNATGSYSFTLTPVSDGKVSVEIIASGITDTAGNSFTPSNPITFKADYTPPAAVISLNVVAGSVTNANKLNGKVAFGEPVTGNLSVNDFTVVNATVSNISGPDANGIYTFNLNPTANGLVAVSLNAPSITDLAGNSATPASPFDFTFDNSSATPTVFLNPVPNNASNALSFFGSVAFGETVTGTLLSSDFKLTNANVSDISGPNATGNYSFTLTPVADGKVSVEIIASGITDTAGNSFTPSNPITFKADYTPPAAVISLNVVAGSVTNANKLNGKVTFGEPVKGNLSINDFTVVNATVSNISGPDANGIYTFNLNPTANGLVAVSLNAPSITDLAGNSATPASPFDFTFDNSSATPTIFLNPVPNNASNALSFFGSVAFGETVTGTLLSSDFKLTNATVSDISGPNATGNYSFTLTPVADGKVSVEIIASGITDTAGNSFTPSNLITFKADYTPPAAVISLNVVAGGSTNSNKLNGKVAFGEPVTGNLSINDFTVVNASVSNISGPDANGIYTFNLNPTANGLVAVSLNAPSITDLAGNSATPASPFDFTFDTSSATPAILLNPVPNTASNALSFSGSVAFGETVTGTLLSSDFKLTNANVSDISGPNATGNYSFKLIPVTDGKVSVEIFASGITDTAGNSFTPSNLITFKADYTPPAAVISLNVVAGSVTNANKLNGKVTFGEPVKGTLSANDFTLVNASVTNISGPDANGTYTFTLNPIANGNVAVSLNAPTIKDLAGNGATPATAITFVSDTLAPVPTISLNPTPTPSSSGTQNQPPSGGGSNSTGSTGGGSSSMNLSGGGLPITDGGTNLSGSSGSGSTGTGSGTTIGVSNNVMLSSPNSELTYSGTISFNELVSGTLLASDFKLINATVSAISGPDAAYQYHFTLAPISSGPVELLLNPNAVVDLAGNGSAISNLISFNSTIGATVDTTPPTLLSIGTGKLSNPTTYVPNQKFLVTFSEPVLGIDPFDFSIITNNEFIPLPLPAVPGQNLTASLTSITRADGGPLTGSAISSVLVSVNSIGRGTLSLELSPTATISDAAGNQIAAPGESVSYGYFSVDTTPLLVLSVGEIASPRTTPVDSISIELSKPLASPMQLEPGIRLLRNDKNFPLGNTLLITQTGYASYSIGNLGTRTGVEGSYQFAVGGANLRDSVGNLGTGLASSTWVSDGPLDVVAPAEFNPPVNFYQFATNVPNRVLLASFTDITGGSISDYEAHVNWGESGSSIPFDQLEALEILPSLTQPNTFDVFGTHTYTLDRNYLINVLIKDSAEVGSFLFGLSEVSIVALTPRQITQQNLSSTTPVFVRGDINSSVLTLSLFPDANANSNTRPLIQAIFNQVPGIGIDERALFLTGYAKNPERKPLPISTSEVASVEWLDLRASGVNTITDPTAFVSASFGFTGSSDQSIQLFYFNPLTNTYDRVFSSGGNAPVVDLGTGTVVVLFDSTSTPTLANLNGTVFAVTVSASASASNPTDTTTPVIAPTTPTTASQTIATTSGSLVQASQTLSELARTEKATDFSSSAGSSAFFVGGRSSTVSLTPSALGRGVSARTRSSAGARTLMASSKDAAMALGSILRGVIAPVEQKLKPWIEAFSTDNAKPIPMPGGAKPAPMAPAAQQAQPPAGAVAPQPNMQTSSIAMPDVQHLVAQPVQHVISDIDADEVWLEPMSLEYSAGLLPLAGALVLTCSDVLGRKKSRKWTEDDHAQGAASDESFS